MKMTPDDLRFDQLLKEQAAEFGVHPLEYGRDLLAAWQEAKARYPDDRQMACEFTASLLLKNTW